jgi:hypothetical protein
VARPLLAFASTRLSKAGKMRLVLLVSSLLAYAAAARNPLHAGRAAAERVAAVPRANIAPFNVPHGHFKRAEGTIIQQTANTTSNGSSQSGG